MVQTKEELAATKKVWREKNKEILKIKASLRWQKKKDNMTAEQKKHRAETNAIWCQKNKVAIAVKRKVSYEKNKERDALAKKKWLATSVGNKKSTITSWRKQGINSDDFNKTYEEFSNTSYCEICFIKLTTGDNPTTATTKSLDHDHLIKTSHNIRNILCHNCNTNDRLCNKSGNSNISGSEAAKKWRYRRTRNGIACVENFITFVEACIFKKQIEDKFNEKNKEIMFREIDEERKKE